MSVNKKYTTEQLNSCSKQELITLLLSQQEQMVKLNEKWKTCLSGEPERNPAPERRFCVKQNF